MRGLLLLAALGAAACLPFKSGGRYACDPATGKDCDAGASSDGGAGDGGGGACGMDAGVKVTLVDRDGCWPQSGNCSWFGQAGCPACCADGVACAGGLDCRLVISSPETGVEPPPSEGWNGWYCVSEPHGAACNSDADCGGCGVCGIISAGNARGYEKVCLPSLGKGKPGDSCNATGAQPCASGLCLDDGVADVIVPSKCAQLCGADGGGCAAGSVCASLPTNEVWGYTAGQEGLLTCIPDPHARMKRVGSPYNILTSVAAGAPGHAIVVSNHDEVLDVDLGDLHATGTADAGQGSHWVKVAATPGQFCILNDNADVFCGSGVSTGPDHGAPNHVSSQSDPAGAPKSIAMYDSAGVTYLKVLHYAPDPTPAPVTVAASLSGNWVDGGLQVNTVPNADIMAASASHTATAYTWGSATWVDGADGGIDSSNGNPTAFAAGGPVMLGDSQGHVYYWNDTAKLWVNLGNVPTAGYQANGVEVSGGSSVLVGSAAGLYSGTLDTAASTLTGGRAFRDVNAVTYVANPDGGAPYEVGVTDWGWIIVRP